MPHSVEKLRIDIREAAKRVLEFVDGRTQEEFYLDTVAKYAVQMQFIIIGEAMARMKRSFPAEYSQIRNADQIVAFRNIVAHGYDVIADNVVWDIIEVNLCDLIEDVQRG